MVDNWQQWLITNDSNALLFSLSQMVWLFVSVQSNFNDFSLSTHWLLQISYSQSHLRLRFHIIKCDCYLWQQYKKKVERAKKKYANRQQSTLVSWRKRNKSSTNVKKISEWDRWWRKRGIYKSKQTNAVFLHYYYSYVDISFFCMLLNF